ncbi:MAG: hypothetical protein Kow0010_20980 [Dehalococcoidia bacterium]
MTSPKSSKWLTLRAAADLLGVSESTIRRWADAGEIRSYRTSGGHRRILEEDVRHIIANSGRPASSDTDRISDLAMARARRKINRSRGGRGADVFRGLDEEARGRLRVIGRQLVDLFARYISSGSRRDRFIEDARVIGHEYGRTLVDAGFGLTAAVSIFNSMRRSLEETASQIASESGLPAEEAVEAIESILGLADTVLEGMAEVYETAGRPGTSARGPGRTAP